MYKKCFIIFNNHRPEIIYTMTGLQGYFQAGHCIPTIAFLKSKLVSAHYLLQQLQHLELPSTNVPALTRREKEILELLAEGLTSHDIANRLFLSAYTVDTHRKNMLQKFNVHNTQALLKVVNSFKMLG